MKLRYLFSIILSSVLLFSSCEEQNTDSWDNIKLSQTYLSISENGGTATLTIDAAEAWEFVTDDVWPEVIKRDKEGNIESTTPSWLVADKMSGADGETKVTFSAEATTSGRELELKIKAGENIQFVRVRQGSMSVTEATCAEIIAGPEGKLYQVTGICTAIANTTYGNWYLNDGTGEIYVYGTVNSSGSYDWSSFNIEVGDEVTVQGSYVLYNGNTPEFVDATFIKVTKSLVKVISEPQTVSKDGGEMEVKVAYKGAGVFPTVPEEYRSWVSIVDMQNKPGEPTKIEPNPADTAIVKIALLPNVGGDRDGSVTFVSSGSSVPYTFTQEGSIVNATIPEFLAAAEDATQYRVCGYIKSISESPSYHNANVTIADAAGNELYLYRLVTSEGNIEDYGFGEGDFITVVGKRSSYNGSPQMAQGCYVESYQTFDITEITVADFLAAEVDSDKRYKITGTVSNVVNTTYGNFDLVDATGTVYVYGLTATPVSSNDKSYSSLGLKEGDTITIVGTRADFKGDAQVGGPAFLLSIVK